MITLYDKGISLIEENRNYLDSNPYLSMFFYMDARLLFSTDKMNYAIKVQLEKDTLLALKVEPYNMLLFGSKTCVNELVSYLMDNSYDIRGLLGSEDVCGLFAQIMEQKYKIPYYEALAMDFMETSLMTEPSSMDVVIPDSSDFSEILECCQQFILDCGLQDAVNGEAINKTLHDFRILRMDGKIVCMGKITPATEDALKIAYVYTRPEYRGRKLARKVVNSMKNEILQQGKIATLNVDRNNPVSNHLYESLGFSKVFSQGEYRRK